MRGRNPSAAPGLEDGRGRATHGASLFVSNLSIFEPSCDKSSRRLCRAGDHEVREVLEYPVVFQRVVNHAQEFAG